MSRVKTSIMPRMPFGKTHTASPPGSPREPPNTLANGGTPPISPERRLSFDMARLSLSKEKRRSTAEKRPGTPKSSEKHGAKVEIVVESPPVILFGTTGSSTGAILSGQLKVAVTEAEVEVEALELKLQSRTIWHKSTQKDCPDCSLTDENIYASNFLSAPRKLVRGTHSFPFSYLLPGSLPASTHCKMCTIEYALLASGRMRGQEVLRNAQPVTIRRALPEPQMNRTSDRIFPPTNLKTQLEHSPVINPIGEFACLFRITGIVHQDKQAKFRWRLRRLNWQINELTTVIAPPCAKHANKNTGDKGGIEHSDSRRVGMAELTSGWKTDYAPSGASTDLEFKIAVNPSLQPTCDVTAREGKIRVTHQLVVELIISEEVSALKSNSWSATGSARVLRAQHVMLLSERTGMGIAWDEEQPPMYEDVPESPPYYQNAACNDYVGDDIPPDDYLDLGETASTGSR